MITKEKAEKLRNTRMLDLAEEVQDICVALYQNGITYGEKTGYEKGLNDAWELVRKAVLDVDEGGLPARNVEEIFGKANFIEILKEFSPQEAIDRFKKYESKIDQEQKEDSGAEIKIGDEVTNVFCDKGIVLGFATFKGHEEMSLLMPNYPVPQMVEKKDYAKTGRHFPQIADFIKMQFMENCNEIDPGNRSTKDN